MKAGRLRRNAELIWQAGVQAVSSERLVRNVIDNTGSELVICGHRIPLETLNRIVVVGAGKAGAGMAAAFEQTVGPLLTGGQLSGWVNVPADCVRPLKRIHLHAARPAGVNEPTQAGVDGSRTILQLVSQLGRQDVCVVLLSGGGSALLPAPVPETTLDDKQQVTRLLMHAGATINELNCVRKQLSQVKGGGLARAAKAGLVVTLIISDVIGDPLDVIASGPTVADSSTASAALGILQKYTRNDTDVPVAVREYLARKSARLLNVESIPPAVHNHVIGNNATAMMAADRQARELGYAVHSLGSDNAGEARVAGRELAEWCLSVRDDGRPLAAPACLLSGGEPVVHLVPSDQPRMGGRNQELAVSALERLSGDGLSRIVLLSGGTDGEDGPTDAAGGIADADVLAAARSLGLVPAEFLAVNNCYPFLKQTGGLFKTGATHTNVMDLRVALVGKRKTSQER
jgi:glycerate-2-kinase